MKEEEPGENGKLNFAAEAEKRELHDRQQLWTPDELGVDMLGATSATGKAYMMYGIIVGLRGLKLKFFVLRGHGGVS